MNGIVVDGSTQFYHILDTTVSYDDNIGVFVSPDNNFISEGSFSRVNIYGSATGMVISSSIATIFQSEMSANHIGLEIDISASAALSQSTMSNNRDIGIHLNAGVANSYGNNYIIANGTDIKTDLGGTFNEIKQR